MEIVAAALPSKTNILYSEVLQYGRQIEDQAERTRILEILRNTPSSEIRQWLKLDQQILIEPDPDYKGAFIRKHPSGKIEHGTIVKRQFVPS